MAADLRHLPSEKAGGFIKKKEEKKGVIVWSLCVIASKPTWGVALLCLLLLPSQSDTPLLPPSPSCVCLQPTAAMLIIWRLRWASLILWWRPSAGCCCSPWARRATPCRGHGTLKRVCRTKPASQSNESILYQHKTTWHCGFSVFMHVKKEDAYCQKNMPYFNVSNTLSRSLKPKHCQFYWRHK